MVDICRTAKRRSKYLLLFTDTEMNNCLRSVDTKPMSSQNKIVHFLPFFAEE